MPTVFLFHGLRGNPQNHWFPWLKAGLLAAGYTVIVPQFPNPGAPKLSEWLAHMEQYATKIDDQTIFVGHDLGSAFALRLLEKSRTAVAATVLTASIWEAINSKVLDPQTQSFTQPAFDWPLTRQKAGEIFVLHADNDPQIWLTGAQKLGRNLGVKTKLIQNGKHLDAMAGYQQFPILLELIRAIEPR